MRQASKYTNSIIILTERGINVVATYIPHATHVEECSILFTFAIDHAHASYGRGNNSIDQAFLILKREGKPL